MAKINQLIDSVKAGLQRAAKKEDDIQRLSSDAIPSPARTDAVPQDFVDDDITFITPDPRPKVNATPQQPEIGNAENDIEFITPDPRPQIQANNTAADQLAVDKARDTEYLTPTFLNFRSAVGDLKRRYIRTNSDELDLSKRYETTTYGKTVIGGIGALLIANSAIDSATEPNYNQSVGSSTPVMPQSASIGLTPQNAVDNMGASGDINFALRRNNTKYPGTL